MIGKAEWFKIRKFGGWGLTPQTKEGWLYVAGFCLPIVVASSLGLLNTQIGQILSAIWTGLLIIDVIDIMLHLKKDEREVLHEALAERNSAWFMVFSIAMIIAYQSVTSAMVGEPKVDYLLLVPLLGGVIVKAISYLYLRDK